MYGFQTCLAWPRDTYTSLVELLGNFGYTITKQSTEEEDGDWFACLWCDVGWQALLVNCDLRVSGDDHYSFPVLSWQWEHPPSHASYRIDIVMPKLVDVGITVKKETIESAFGIYGLGSDPDHLAKQYRQNKNRFWAPLVEKAYVHALRAIPLPRPVSFPEKAWKDIQPIRPSFEICKSGVETLKSLGVPSVFLPFPQGESHYLWVV
jgi:hypothetical protein